MPGRMDIPGSNAIDVSKRYDIYVSEALKRVVVYRSALFRGPKALESSKSFDIWSDFIEIEQSDGSSVFVRRHSLLYFCDVGTQLNPEPVQWEE